MARTDHKNSYQGASQRHYFTAHYFQWVALLFVVGAILRFYQLDVRPVHHDESLHGMYSKYVFDGQGYRYDPMLHGPLLYNITGWLFTLFGLSTWVLRSLNAALGSAFILTPFLFRRYLSRTAVLSTTAFLTISPTLIYWSRFAHHDYLVLGAYVLLAAGVLLTPKRGGIILVCLSFALQYSIKANVFVFAALLLGYLLFELIISLIRSERSYAGAIVRHIYHNWLEFLLGIAVAVLTFCALYSADFRYPESILDGLYRKVFDYWIEQHRMQRLDGPFAYHLLVLCFYELPLLLAGIFALGLTVRDFSRSSKALFLIPSAALLGISFFIPPEQYANGFLKQSLKLTGWFDLWTSGTVAILAVLLPLHHRWRNERALSFFGYLSLATLWVYGFLGEKVPWLTIYPAVTLLIYSVLRFDHSAIARISFGKVTSLARLLRLTSAAVLSTALVCAMEVLLRGMDDPFPESSLRLLGWSLGFLLFFAALELIGASPQCKAGHYLLGLGSLLLIHSTIITNYTAAGAPTELLSQVHTTKEIQRLFVGMREELTNPLHADDLQILVSGASVWPGTWYLLDLPGFHFSVPEEDYSTMTYIVADEGTAKLPQDYESQTIPLQSWWVPDYPAMRLRDLLGYFFTHTPWNPTGSLNVKFLRTLYSENTENAPVETSE